MLDATIYKHDKQQLKFLLKTCSFKPVINVNIYIRKSQSVNSEN